ncbi:hypothetical protein CMV_027796, partial [Castanea mollissima]
CTKAKREGQVTLVYMGGAHLLTRTHLGPLGYSLDFLYFGLLRDIGLQSKWTGL